MFRYPLPYNSLHGLKIILHHCYSAKTTNTESVAKDMLKVICNEKNGKRNGVGSGEVWGHTNKALIRLYIRLLKNPGNIPLDLQKHALNVKGDNKNWPDITIMEALVKTVTKVQPQRKADETDEKYWDRLCDVIANELAHKKVNEQYTWLQKDVFNNTTIKIGEKNYNLGTYYSPSIMVIFGTDTEGTPEDGEYGPVQPSEEVMFHSWGSLFFGPCQIDCKGHN